MIRAIRPSAMAQDDATLVTGWNVSPNAAYTLIVIPGETTAVAVLMDETQTVRIASGSALVGTDQPCWLYPFFGHSVGMVDADLGWHVLLTTGGTEPAQAIRIGPAVDLPDETHPVYGSDELAVVRATAAIDAAAHYIDDVSVMCPLGLADGIGLGSVVSVPVDGVALVGQVEGVTWTADPDGTYESVVIRRHVPITADPYVAPEPVVPPTVVDDAAETDAVTEASGNVLANDEAGLTVVAVNGLSANVGMAVNGNNGGTFTIGSSGAWTFDPDGDFSSLTGSDTATTSVTYHASDGVGEAMGTLTLTVSAFSALIELVDEVTMSATATPSTMTLSLPNSIRVGDVVVFSIGTTTIADVNLSVSTSGFTELCDLYANDNRDANLGVYIKVMREAPDTQIQFSGPAEEFQSTIAWAGIYRNVDNTNPLDVSTVTATGVDSVHANSPSVTPVTDGAMILTFGSFGIDSATNGGLPTQNVSAPMGFDLRHFSQRNGGSRRVAGLGVASRSWQTGDGSVDPAAWSTVNTNSSSNSSWAAATVVLRRN